MRSKASSAVWIFLGALLTFCFVIGLIYVSNPGALLRAKSINIAWEQFIAFCGNWYPVFAIIGIPMFLVSLILSLVRERKESRR